MAQLLKIFSFVCLAFLIGCKDKPVVKDAFHIQLPNYVKRAGYVRGVFDIHVDYPMRLFAASGMTLEKADKNIYVQSFIGNTFNFLAESPKAKPFIAKNLRYEGNVKDKALLDKVFQEILLELQSNPEKYVFKPISDVDTTKYLASRMILLE
jgi:hypothetical protein